MKPLYSLAAFLFAAAAAHSAGPALFDLATDLGETKNLATETPGKAKELKLLLESIRGGQ